jgi:hypothetical protein
MEMHQVRYFLATASELNFTKVAETCNVTQPSLTRAIKQLKDEFGSDLFRRERPHAQLSVKDGSVPVAGLCLPKSTASQDKRTAVASGPLKMLPATDCPRCTN